MNSKFKDKVICEDLRYIDWDTRNGNCPANLDESDFDKVVSSNKLFARKIDLPLAEKLVRKLMEKIKTEN